MDERAQEIRTHMDMIATQTRAAEDERAQCSKGKGLIQCLFVDRARIYIYIYRERERERQCDMYAYAWRERKIYIYIVCVCCKER